MKLQSRKTMRIKVNHLKEKKKPQFKSLFFQRNLKENPKICSFPLKKMIKRIIKLPKMMIMRHKVNLKIKNNLLLMMKYPRWPLLLLKKEETNSKREDSRKL